MAPQDDVLKIGDVVEVVNMPDSSGMNGIVGTLLKTVGKGRWALKVEGDDRSKVVSADNLQKKALQPKTAQVRTGPRKYSIVGTWDDWEPNEMSWNGESGCFEYRVIMGDSGTESFKILQDSDWDKCVYPNRKDASPHVDHELRGPDDGGLDEEWTIGLDSKDDTTEGTCYKVRFLVESDGRPKQLTWEILRKDGGKQRAPAAERVQASAPPEEQAPRVLDRGGDREASRMAQRAAYAEAMAPASDMPQGGGPETAEMRLLGKEIVQQEEEARKRLARRFEDAAEILMPAIKDDDEYGETDQRQLMAYSADLEAQLHTHQIEVNLDRYRKSVQENTAGPRMELFVMRPAPNGSEVCVECGQPTSNKQDGALWCEKCYKDSEASRKDGWDPAVLCNGFPAAMRAEELVLDGSLSRDMARKYVMRKYPHSFQH